MSLVIIGDLVSICKLFKYFQVTSPTAMTLSSINEIDHSKSLNDILPHIQLLWELVLLGEPLVIMAPSPTACSNTVLALISSISPLRYLIF